MYAERTSSVAGAVAWCSVREAAQPVPVLPDACMDVIWRRGAVVIAGPDTSTHLFEARSGEIVVGLRFRTGVLPSVLGVPATEFVDLRVDLEAVSPTAARSIAAGMEAAVMGAAAMDAADARVAESVLARLETEVARRLPAPGPTRLDVEMVRQIGAGVAVRRVAEDLGLSERQLRRRCRASAGYGPAMLRRILRLDAAVASARSGTPLATVAASGGYDDQSHLCRDVRELAGAPLRELVAT